MDPHGFLVSRREMAPINTTNPEDLLDEEFPVKIPNQNYALLSYLGPKTTPSASWFGLRIYGTFATIEEANKAARKAKERDFNSFDLFVVDICHGFFPLPPPCDSDINEIQYSTDVLAQLMRQDQEHMDSANRRVGERADSEIEMKTSGDLLSEMAQAAITLLKEKQTDNQDLVEMLVDRFRSISDLP